MLPTALGPFPDLLQGLRPIGQLLSPSLQQVSSTVAQQRTQEMRSLPLGMKMTACVPRRVQQARESCVGIHRLSA